MRATARVFEISDLRLYGACACIICREQSPWLSVAQRRHVGRAHPLPQVPASARAEDFSRAGSLRREPELEAEEQLFVNPYRTEAIGEEFVGPPMDLVDREIWSPAPTFSSAPRQKGHLRGADSRWIRCRQGEQSGWPHGRFSISCGGTPSRHTGYSTASVASRFKART